MSPRPESADAAAERVRRATDTYRRLKRVQTIGTLAFWLGAGAVLLLVPGNHPWASVAAPSVGVAVISARWLLGLRNRAALCAAIEALDDAEHLGLAISASLEGLELPADARDRARRRVTDLLPLAMSRRHCLPPREMAALRALASGVGITLQIRALAYMAEVGDLGAIPLATQLSARASSPEVREAAARCRDRLLAVQADAERSGSLLRPAEAPGETLLRPTEPVAEGQLLRAVEGEAE